MIFTFCTGKVKYLLMLGEGIRGCSITPRCRSWCTGTKSSALAFTVDTASTCGSFRVSSLFSQKHNNTSLFCNIISHFIDTRLGNYLSKLHNTYTRSYARLGVRNMVDRPKGRHSTDSASLRNNLKSVV